LVQIDNVRVVDLDIGAKQIGHLRDESGHHFGARRPSRPRWPMICWRRLTARYIFSISGPLKTRRLSPPQFPLRWGLSCTMPIPQTASSAFCATAAFLSSSIVASTLLTRGEACREHLPAGTRCQHSIHFAMIAALASTGSSASRETPGARLVRSRDRRGEKLYSAMRRDNRVREAGINRNLDQG
jgi:hypothetical protein